MSAAHIPLGFLMAVLLAGPAVEEDTHLPPEEPWEFPSREAAQASRDWAELYLEWLQKQLDAKVHPDMASIEGAYRNQKHVINVWNKIYYIVCPPFGPPYAREQLCEMLGWEDYRARKWPDPAPSWFNTSFLPPPKPPVMSPTANNN